MHHKVGLPAPVVAKLKEQTALQLTEFDKTALSFGVQPAPGQLRDHT